MNIKKTISRVFRSAVFSAGLGNLVVLVFLMATLVSRYGAIDNAFTGALMLYLMTVLVCIGLAVLIAGPIYLLLLKYSLANYLTATALGVLVCAISLGFDIHSRNIIWCVAGGLVGALFHYRYSKLSAADRQTD